MGKCSNLARVRGVSAIASRYDGVNLKMWVIPRREWWAVGQGFSVSSEIGNEWVCRGKSPPRALDKSRFDCVAGQIGDGKGGRETECTFIEVQSLISESKLGWWLGRLK